MNRIVHPPIYFRRGGTVLFVFGGLYVKKKIEIHV